MDAMHLSDRLATVAAYVPDGARLADIGSDHAYLPANLILNKRIKFAVAGEVAQGPLENAEQEINKHHLNDQLIPRLADGLAAIQPEDRIDTVVIAGMGGRLIQQILEAGSSATYKRLILQPNIDVDAVRTWLQANQYQITDERVLLDDGHYYEVVVAEPGTVEYDAMQLAFGPVNMVKNDSIWRQKWEREQGRMEKIMQQLEAANQTQAEAYRNYQEQVAQIKEVLAHAGA
ncbi:tRNA (adenine(22)-N(1))-methyltransferase [Weissella viridescens]|uniref:tRNA (adenine(22)-N(1))-methyltransferase n=1 Tax=Weissella viridescens TaxID=1629 RepID=UPI0025790719|nr:tRNA (adenine(22)-N(1))-methyltransferase TrmK [Weissella viridescens]WJI90696.1 tRNA (adenine(22)-N(1))-methyltransferase TrmK [Weissella viridescens]